MREFFKRLFSGSQSGSERFGVQILSTIIKEHPEVLAMHGELHLKRVTGDVLASIVRSAPSGTGERRFQAQTSNLVPAE